MSQPIEGGGAIKLWREELEGDAAPVLRTQAGEAVAVRHGAVTYLGGWLEEPALLRLLRQTLEAAGLAPVEMPDGLRRRIAGETRQRSMA